MTYKNLQELKTFLKRDNVSNSLNPVRFISVDSLDMWTEAKKILMALADESIMLSEYCDGNDATPNIRRLLSTLKKVNSSVLVIPLSELLRIKPESARDTINKIIKLDYQNNTKGNLRIYFLMYRSKSILRTIPTDDPRTVDCISYLETDEESDYKLTIVQKNLNVSLTGNEIVGFRNYLEYWEANPDKPLILRTGNAIYFEKSNFFDDVTVIASSFDLIKELCSIPSNMDESWGSTAQWDSFVCQITPEMSLDSICCSILSTNKYSIELFKNWSTMSDFQRWTLLIWTKLQSASEYLLNCAAVSKTIDQFVNSLYCLIKDYLDSSKFGEIYEERKNLLEYIKSVPTEEFWQLITEVDKLSALSYLTNLTDRERKTIFSLISDVKFSDRRKVISIIMRVYPQLYHYLENDSTPNKANLSEEHYRYFQEYKWIKATNNLTSDFVDKVKEIAKQKGENVLALRSLNAVVSDNYDQKAAILFVDGMGIEYVDYLSFLLSDLDESKYLCSFEACYCNLPSVSDKNREFMADKTILKPEISKIDELKHSKTTYPESIIQQFACLDSLKDILLGHLNGDNDKVIVVSDHGTSRPAVLIRDTEFDSKLPKPDNAKIYEFGRYCSDTADESKYPTMINFGGYLVFADYSRFIQKGKPFDEVHGGASLEEWIVPVITIEKTVGSNPKKVVITHNNVPYRPDAKTQCITVSFAISGNQRQNVLASIKGQKIECKYDGSSYVFDYKPCDNDQKLIVKVLDGVIIGQFEIEIIKGITQNKKFDI